MQIFKRLFQRDFGVLAGGLVQQLLCNHIRSLIKRNFASYLTERSDSQFYCTFSKSISGTTGHVLPF